MRMHSASGDNRRGANFRDYPRTMGVPLIIDYSGGDHPCVVNGRSLRNPSERLARFDFPGPARESAMRGNETRAMLARIDRNVEL